MTISYPSAGGALLLHHSLAPAPLAQRSRPGHDSDCLSSSTPGPYRRMPPQYRQSTRKMQRSARVTRTWDVCRTNTTMASTNCTTSTEVWGGGHSAPSAPLTQPLLYTLNRGLVGYCPARPGVRRDLSLALSHLPQHQAGPREKPSGCWHRCAVPGE